MLSIHLRNLELQLESLRNQLDDANLKLTSSTTTTMVVESSSLPLNVVMSEKLQDHEPSSHSSSRSSPSITNRRDSIKKGTPSPSPSPPPIPNHPNHPSRTTTQKEEELVPKSTLVELEELLASERKLREQLEIQQGNSQLELNHLRVQLKEFESKVEQKNQKRKAELQEMNTNDRKSNKILLEEKHLLQDQVETLQKDLAEQALIRDELEGAFSEKLSSLISTIDGLYDKRAQLELENQSLLARVDDMETHLINETRKRSELEAKYVALAQEQMQLQNELMDETNQQTRLKEEFAAQLESFCAKLDAMYDRQQQLENEKGQLEETIDSLELKLLDEAKLRVELNEKVKSDAKLRQELEAHFVEKLEQLSALILAD